MSAVVDKKLAKKLKRALNGKKKGGTGLKGEFTKAQAKRGKQLLKVAAKNPITGIRGQGNYFTEPGAGGTSLINKAFSGAGAGLASVLGVPELGGAASAAGSWLSKVLGFGAYRINKNTVASPGFSNMSPGGGPNNIPEFGTTASRGSIRVRHREFVTDILSSTSFVLQNWLIHVGNPTLWPWLANLAQNFEEAQIHGALLEFKPTSAYAVAGTQAMGNVIMATDYDVVDANYTSKREMEIVEFSSSAMSNVCQIHPIECDPKQNVLARHYIQQGATSIADFPDDPRFGCLGNFQLATNAMPTTGEAVGELWITYDVELIKPQLSNGASTGSPEWHLTGNYDGSGVESDDGGVAAGFPIPVPITIVPVNLTDTTSGFNATFHTGGFYQILTNAQSMASFGTVFTPFSLGPGANYDARLSDNTGNNSVGALVIPDGASWMAVALVEIVTVPCTIFIDVPWNNTATTYFDVLVTAMNPSVDPLLYSAGRRRALTALDKKLKMRDDQLAKIMDRLKFLEGKDEDSGFTSVAGKARVMPSLVRNPSTKGLDYDSSCFAKASTSTASSALVGSRASSNK